MYTLTSRGVGLYINLNQYAVHPTSRFLYTQLPPYVSPTWYPGQPTGLNNMATKAKPVPRGNFRPPQRAK